MTPDSDIEVLRRIAFFESFSDDHLRLVASSAESRSLPEKLLLYDEGQLLHSAYVVVSGTLRGERKGKAGEEPRRRTIEANVILGERALILETRADESVRVEARSRVLQLRKAMFRRLLQEHPDIARALRSRFTQSVLRASAEFNEVARRLGAIQS